MFLTFLVSYSTVGLIITILAYIITGNKYSPEMLLKIGATWPRYTWFLSQRDIAKLKKHYPYDNHTPDLN